MTAKWKDGNKFFFFFSSSSLVALHVDVPKYSLHIPFSFTVSPQTQAACTSQLKNIDLFQTLRTTTSAKQLLAVLLTVVHPEMHVYSHKSLTNVAVKYLFPQLALVRKKSFGITRAYHTKKSCLQYVQSTPTPTIQKFSHRLVHIFLIEFSLFSWANCKGENMWSGK